MPINHDADDLDRPVWGAQNIGRVIGLSQRQAFHALENGLIPATKIGTKWVSTPRRLLARIRGEAPAGHADATTI